jgi:hypothetical protein
MEVPVVSSEGNSTTEQIQVWSKQVEQKSIELGLEYDYIFHTDIVDCYGAIYTLITVLPSFLLLVKIR